MGNLHRTQIYLEDEQISRLKVEAGKARLAVSELIRRAIDHFLKGSGDEVDWDNDPITKAVGKIKSGPKDASSKHDHYLYGKERK